MAIKCVVVTPEKTELEQDATLVVVPMQDGEAGFQENAAPIIGRLGCGELRLVETSSSAKRFFIDGGFVQIADNTISVITNRLIRVEDLNLENLRRELTGVEEKTAATPSEQAIKGKTLEQLRAQIRIADPTSN